MKLRSSILFILPFIVAKTCKENLPKPCFDKTQIEKQWRNVYTLVEDCDQHGKVLGSYKLYPEGTFTLTANGNYHVMSDNVPLDGKWQIDANCKLTLDAGDSNKRTFAIEEITGSSLVISRSDASNQAIYIQHYTSK